MKNFLYASIAAVRRLFAATTVLALPFLLLAANSASAQNVYVTNYYSGDVSVIDPATNTLIATIYGFNGPVSVAVTPDGGHVYVANVGTADVRVIDTATNTVTTIITIPLGGIGNTPGGMAVSLDGRYVYVGQYAVSAVSVIDTATNTVTATIMRGFFGPGGLAVTPDGSHVYVANQDANNTPIVSVIDTATNIVTNISVPVLVAGQRAASQTVAVAPDGSRVYVGIVAQYFTNTGVSIINTATNIATKPIPINAQPLALAVTPDGSKVYVAGGNNGANNGVRVIDTATNTVTAPIIPLIEPSGVAVTPDGGHVYVSTFASDQNANNPGSVAVIATASDALTGSITVDLGPQGVAIQPAGPAPRFAGTPGTSTCHGDSVSALAHKFGGLKAAAASMGISVQALQKAIAAYCRG